jgi:micrococcal nuclease
MAVAAGRSGRRLSAQARLGAALGFVVALVALGTVQQANQGSSTATLASATPTGRVLGVATSPPTAEPTPTPEPTPEPDPTFRPDGQTTDAVVMRVTDGDTIIAAFGGRRHSIRYIGIDAPETADPDSNIQAIGRQATAVNAALVEGMTVVLEKDVSDVDQFDRLLRHVWLTDGTTWTLVNLELVSQGLASANSYPPDVKYDAIYRNAEALARASGRGLWRPTPAKPTAPATLLPSP